MSSNKMFSLNPLINRGYSSVCALRGYFQDMCTCLWGSGTCRGWLHDMRPCMCLPICRKREKVCVCVCAHVQTSVCRYRSVCGGERASRSVNMIANDKMSTWVC